MIEKFPTNFEKLPEEKKSEQELEFENLELVESKEKELREDFAKELKKPHEGSYYSKLQRIAAAFVLAGFSIVATPNFAITPEKSKQMKSLEQLASHSESPSPATKEDTELYRRIVEGLYRDVEIKGGIATSPQLPEEVYKPDVLSDAALEAVGKAEPYFSKPEIIFGEEFVKKNPEKAKEYFERISKTQKATVIITNKTGMGSGVIINTEKGKVILTNEHVVSGENSAWVEFINGNNVEVKVLNADSKQDIAILKIDLSEDIIKDKKVLEGTNSLDLDPDVELKPKENLALIGHPMGYPFEVSLAKLENVMSELVQEESQNGFINTSIISKPDERFAKLASYDISPRLRERWGSIAHKGEAIWGMSGGPIIKLDEKGEPRLVGINAQRVPANKENFSYFAIGVGVHSRVIGNFLEKSGYPATAAVSKE